MDDKLPCFECRDGHYEPINQLFIAFLPDGKELTVPDIDVLTCVKCGAECLDSENSKKIEHAREENKLSKIGNLNKRDRLLSDEKN